ncbi:major facilitator superfamily domain-containing protein [Bombardia bombarda]|uniref:Major facilitator superfamily domain-containing protein n=1 Tax=Bombardia bombarda TaxID=252184 RepID=A0AA39XL23_9PEZI|nr:major facilitator superfamily domain-containing protein [Bombardia bombarda]
MARQVLRKIDRRLLPLLFITCMLNFMDKTILSVASVFGLQHDTGLKGQEYSWVSSIFYFGYFVWAYPTTFLISRLPVAKYLTANTVFWGLVVALTGACTNYGGLLTMRFLLGVAEATILPALMFIMSTWYTRDEIPTRIGICLSGNSVGGLAAGLLGFAIGQIRDSIAPWRWMFILLGLCTFLWAFVLLWLLPDSISSAKFLTVEERQHAGDRVVAAGTGRTEKTSWHWDQTWECLIDPKTWFILGLQILTQIPNGGTQNFAHLVITSFGFTDLQSTLINIPYSLICGGVIMGTGYLASRHRNINCLLLIAVVLPCVVGSAIIYARERTSKGAQLFGYFLLSTGPATMPLVLSLVQVNYRGVTKKMTATALCFLMYCAGNIIGPQLFRTSEAPTYHTAFGGIIICYSLVAAISMGLISYLRRVNARRVREQRPREAVAQNGTHIVNEDELIWFQDYEDTTDWKTPGFGYRY